MSDARPTPRGRRPGPVAELLRMAWQTPLIAVPFTGFFAVLFGARSPRALLLAYLVTLYFAVGPRLGVWIATHFVVPRVVGAGGPLTRAGFVRHAALMVGSSVVGAYTAALAVHLTLIPGFLGSVRGVLMVTMFTLLFAVLVSAVMYAWHFFDAALKRARSEEELELARRIQRGFLMTSFPRRPRLEVHALNLSSREVSGDFYDVVPAGDDAFLVAIADVSGKGVPAALLSSMLQASVRTQAGLQRSTAAILANVNRLVCESTSRRQFATFFLALVDERALTLTYTNAGHNPPLLLRTGERPRALERGGTVVGMLDSVTYDEETVALRPGDRLVAYTDGLSEAQRPDGAMFGDERVAELAAALDPALSAEAVCDRLREALSAWLAGREAGDDVTLLALRVLEPAAPAPPRA